VKNAGLLPMFEASKRLIARLPRVALEHVPRARNKEADRLANEAMDTRGEDPPGVSAGMPLPRAGASG
jgi:probable phosphoglycerate mutase